jgi:hypothetical protein
MKIPVHSLALLPQSDERTFVLELFRDSCIFLLTDIRRENKIVIKERAKLHHSYTEYLGREFLA